MKPRKPTTAAERREATLRRRLTDEEYKALSAFGSAEAGHPLKEGLITKAHHLKARKPKGLARVIPINFLLGCSEHSLDNYALARLAEANDLRREFYAIFDRLVEQTALSALAEWFRTIDRHDLRVALENPDDVVAWAQEQIRNQGKSEEEIEAELIPLPCLPPGAAHLAAAIRYAERNIAEGKCSICPKPLAHHSVRYCEEHLAKARHREQQKKGLSLPGGREYLYSGEITPSAHGRQPGSLAACEMNREKATRRVLAELGISPESAAVSLKAAKEALLRVMPDSEAKAMSPADLRQAATVPSKTTGDKALRELLSAGKIQRVGQPKPGHPCRYFKRDA